LLLLHLHHINKPYQDTLFWQTTSME